MRNIEKINKGRTLVCGDIHGGLRALKQVLERSSYKMNDDQLIFLGDYCDGWSETAELIQFLIDLESNADIKPIFLMGNHDEWVKDFLTMGIADPTWLQNGGYSTVKSYNEMWKISEDVETLAKHRNFLKNLHYHYVDDQNRAFVHAGCDLKGGVTKTIPYSKVWDRTMWRLAKSGAICKAHKEVYIGHTTTLMNKCKPHYPESKLQEVGKPITVPMNRQNVWNLDTGGGWSGKLTIMDIDTKEFWQSDFVKDLYPEEKGR